MSGPQARHKVTFSAPGIGDVTVAMAEPSPRQTGGGPKWEIRERRRRPSMTIWTGRDPVVIEIAILFDGLADDQSVENDISNLDRMTRGIPPPIVDCQGAHPRRDINNWNMTISYGQDVIWDMEGGSPVRLRQDAVVTLTEHIKPDVVRRRGQSAPAKGRGGLPKPRHHYVIVKRGDTLSEIAVREYRAAKWWRNIAKANKIRDPKNIKVGQKLRMP